MGERPKTGKCFVAIMIPPIEAIPITRILETYSTHRPLICLGHITLLDPFIEHIYFDEAKEKLREKLFDFEPFTLSLTEVGMFRKKKQSILWVKPNDEDGKLGLLQRTVMEVYPYCDDVVHHSENGYTPHITVAKMKYQQVLKAKEELEKTFQPIEFLVKEIQFLSKVESSFPYEVRATIPLGRNVTPSHFEDVPYDKVYNSQ